MSLGNDFVHSYEIKTAKTGHLIPVVNDVHLHSAYDPIKEAEGLAQKMVGETKKKNFLILGLGFGYHIHAIKELVSANTSLEQIVIIEPNAQVASDCIERGLIDPNIYHLAINQTPQEIYSNRELTKFLLKKPQVISHPSSFNLYSSYYKDLLSYQSAQNLEELTKQIESPTLREYLQDIAQSGHSNIELFEYIGSQTKLHNELDFLILALQEMTHKSEQLTHG